MARIRSIHPEQWTDDAFVSCSPLARLLALAIRNYADDNGVFEWNIIKMKMQCLPGDNCDIGALVDELVSSRQILRFEHGGRSYGLVRNFKRFQRPKKPISKHPFPVGSEFNEYVGSQTDNGATDDAGASTEQTNHEGVIGGEPVGNRFGTSQSDGVVGGIGEKGSRRRKASLTPIPQDFSASESVTNWAFQRGVTADELRQHLASFREKCEAKGYQYANWDAAFRNAIQDNWAGVGVRKVGAQQSTSRLKTPAHDAEYGPL